MSSKKILQHVDVCRNFSTDIEKKCNMSKFFDMTKNLTQHVDIFRKNCNMSKFFDMTRKSYTTSCRKNYPTSRIFFLDRKNYRLPESKIFLEIVSTIGILKNFD